MVLKIVAVAVVAQAVWGMARNLCPDRERATLAVSAAILALAVPAAVGQIGAIVAGGLIGWAVLRNVAALPPGGAAGDSSAALVVSDRGDRLLRIAVRAPGAV